MEEVINLLRIKLRPLRSRGAMMSVRRLMEPPRCHEKQLGSHSRVTVLTKDQTRSLKCLSGAETISLLGISEISLTPLVPHNLSESLTKTFAN